MELKDILYQRNELKARLSDLEDELSLYRPKNKNVKSTTQGALDDSTNNKQQYVIVIDTLPFCNVVAAAGGGGGGVRHCGGGGGGSDKRYGDGNTYDIVNPLHFNGTDKDIPLHDFLSTNSIPTPQHANTRPTVSDQALINYSPVTLAKENYNVRTPKDLTSASNGEVDVQGHCHCRNNLHALPSNNGNDNSIVMPVRTNSQDSNSTVVSPLETSQSNFGDHLLLPLAVANGRYDNSELTLPHSGQLIPLSRNSSGEFIPLSRSSSGALNPLSRSSSNGGDISRMRNGVSSEAWEDYRCRTLSDGYDNGGSCGACGAGSDHCTSVSDETLNVISNDSIPYRSRVDGSISKVSNISASLCKETNGHICHREIQRINICHELNSLDFNRKEHSRIPSKIPDFPARNLLRQKHIHDNVPIVRDGARDGSARCSMCLRVGQLVPIEHVNWSSIFDNVHYNSKKYSPQSNGCTLPVIETSNDQSDIKDSFKMSFEAVKVTNFDISHPTRNPLDFYYRDIVDTKIENKVNSALCQEYINSKNFRTKAHICDFNEDEAPRNARFSEVTKATSMDTFLRDLSGRDLARLRSQSECSNDTLLESWTATGGLRSGAEEDDLGSMDCCSKFTDPDAVDCNLVNTSPPVSSYATAVYSAASYDTALGSTSTSGSDNVTTLSSDSVTTLSSDSVTTLSSDNVTTLSSDTSIIDSVTAISSDAAVSNTVTKIISDTSPDDTITQNLVDISKTVSLAGDCHADESDSHSQNNNSPDFTDESCDDIHHSQHFINKSSLPPPTSTCSPHFHHHMLAADTPPPPPPKITICSDVASLPISPASLGIRVDSVGNSTNSCVNTSSSSNSSCVCYQQYNTRDSCCPLYPHQQYHCNDVCPNLHGAIACATNSKVITNDTNNSVRTICSPTCSGRCLHSSVLQSSVTCSLKPSSYTNIASLTHVSRVPRVPPRLHASGKCVPLTNDDCDLLSSFLCTYCCDFDLVMAYLHDIKPNLLPPCNSFLNNSNNNSNNEVSLVTLTNGCSSSISSQERPCSSSDDSLTSVDSAIELRDSTNSALSCSNVATTSQTSNAEITPPRCLTSVASLDGNIPTNITSPSCHNPSTLSDNVSSVSSPSTSIISLRNSSLPSDTLRWYLRVLTDKLFGNLLRGISNDGNGNETFFSMVCDGSVMVVLLQTCWFLFTVLLDFLS